MISFKKMDPATSDEISQHRRLVKEFLSYLYNLRVCGNKLSPPLFSDNRSSFLKTMLFRDDERLLFVLRRYFQMHTIGEDQLLNELLELSLKESMHLFDQIFVNCSLASGKKLSNEERKEKSIKATSLTYGEIDYRSFASILRSCCCGMDTRDKVFIDLGSGTGRAVIAARINEDFAKCEGIELLHGLYDASVEVQGRFTSIFADLLSRQTSRHVSFVEGSILEIEWTYGDIIFANSTCFGKELMAQVSVIAENVKPGTIFISFTNQLSSDCFEVLEKTQYSMSWGPATVYVHRRLPQGVTINDPSYDASKCKPLNFWKAYVQSISAASPPQKKKSLPTATTTNSNSSNNSNSCGSNSTSALSSSSPVGSPSKAGSPGKRNRDISSVANGVQEQSVPSDSLQAALPSSLTPGEHTPFTYYAPSQTDTSSTTAGKAGTKTLTQMKLMLWAPHTYSSQNYQHFSLVVFLHGASARGNDTEELLKFGLPHYLTENAATNTLHPSFNHTLVLSPLCPSGVEWKTPHVCDILAKMVDAVVSTFSVDAKRVYVTGISMGGLGAYMFAVRNLAKVAAVAPMCGGGPVVYARLLNDVPSWFVHAVNDNVVAVEETDKVVAALKNEGALDVHYSRYEVCDEIAAAGWMEGHNCWDRIYKDSDFWSWLFSKHRE